jgi:hypothetical protein
MPQVAPRGAQRCTFTRNRRATESSISAAAGIPEAHAASLAIDVRTGGMADNGRLHRRLFARHYDAEPRDSVSVANSDDCRDRGATRRGGHRLRGGDRFAGVTRRVDRLSFVTFEVGFQAGFQNATVRDTDIELSSRLFHVGRGFGRYLP